MADVVIDADVLVALLDENDSLSAQATALLARLDADGHVPVVLDVLLGEAVSVLCRRAAERKANPPDLARALDQARSWLERGEVAFVGRDQERLLGAMLDVVKETGGKVNVNDALLVVLQREGSIGDVASFDKKLDTAVGFRRVS
ncbi:MAG TPA: type II toxin-antitoxin system VapC family toxin [Polyangiaceae bacterium]|jgi:predicted nucleic acid-binding protein|nr:type II toxin-antitoxin system VapC family toxin [Polyangiaceae bacterium]